MMKQRKLIRILSSLLLVMVFALFMGSCVVDPWHDHDDRDHSASESFSYDVDINNRSIFRIRGISGDIEIIGTNTSTVEIWGEKTVRASSYHSAESHLDDLRIRIDTDSDEVFVWTDQPRNDRYRDYEVDYQIRIPKDWKVLAENVNGDIEIDTIENDVVGGITNGNLNLLGILGNIAAGVTNGDIEFYDVEGSVEAGVTNGGIDGDMVLPEDGVCILGITNGNIDLSVPDNTSAIFTARVTNGNISVSGLPLTNLSTSERTTSGTLGSGDGTITLTVTNGGINVQGY